MFFPLSFFFFPRFLPVIRLLFNMNDRVSRPERVLFCTPFLILWVEEIFGNSGNDDFNYFLFYIVLLD